MGAIAILGGIVGKLGKHIIPGLGVLTSFQVHIIAAKAISYTNSVVPRYRKFSFKVANMAIGIGAMFISWGSRCNHYWCLVPYS